MDRWAAVPPNSMSVTEPTASRRRRRKWRHQVAISPTRSRTLTVHFRIDSMELRKLGCKFRFRCHIRRSRTTRWMEDYGDGSQLVPDEAGDPATCKPLRGFCLIRCSPERRVMIPSFPTVPVGQNAINYIWFIDIRLWYKSINPVILIESISRFGSFSNQAKWRGWGRRSGSCQTLGDVGAELRAMLAQSRDAGLWTLLRRQRERCAPALFPRLLVVFLHSGHRRETLQRSFFGTYRPFHIDISVQLYVDPRPFRHSASVGTINTQFQLLHLTNPIDKHRLVLIDWFLFYSSRVVIPDD